VNDALCVRNQPSAHNHQFIPYNGRRGEIFGEVHAACYSQRFLVVIQDQHCKWPELAATSTVTSSAIAPIAIRVARVCNISADTQYRASSQCSTHSPTCLLNNISMALTKQTSTSVSSRPPDELVNIWWDKVRLFCGIEAEANVVLQQQIFVDTRFSQSSSCSPAYTFGPVYYVIALSQVMCRG